MQGRDQAVKGQVVHFYFKSLRLGDGFDDIHVKTQIFFLVLILETKRRVGGIHAHLVRLGRRSRGLGRRLAAASGQSDHCQN